MDLAEIKEIIEADGGKFIIVEEGKPSLVIMSFEDYKKSLKNKGQKTLIKKEKEKTSPSQKTAKSSLTPHLAKEEELTIEDLPF